MDIYVNVVYRNIVNLKHFIKLDQILRLLTIQDYCVRLHKKIYTHW